MYKYFVLPFPFMVALAFAKDPRQTGGGGPSPDSPDWKFGDGNPFHGANKGGGKRPPPVADGVSHLDQLKDTLCRAFSMSHASFRGRDSKTQPALLYQLPCRPILSKNIDSEITWASIAQNFDGVFCTDLKTPGIKVRSIIAKRDDKSASVMKSGDSVFKFSELFQEGTISEQALSAYPRGELNAPDIRMASARSSYCNELKEKMTLSCDSQSVCVGLYKK